MLCPGIRALQLHWGNRVSLGVTMLESEEDPPCSHRHRRQPGDVLQNQHLWRGGLFGTVGGGGGTVPVGSGDPSLKIQCIYLICNLFDRRLFPYGKDPRSAETNDDGAENKEHARKDALSLLLSALKAKAKDKREDLTEEEEDAIILKEIKQVKKHWRAPPIWDIIEECEFKLKVLSEFAPKA